MAKRATPSRPPNARPRTNLAPPLGRFVGRAALLDAIAAHVARGDRLVTLLGPPGIGKTRLAMRYGETRGEPYLRGGGLWFCDLTEARDVADVCAVVAKALGVRLAAELDVETTSERVGDGLAEAGPLLLVLDNFEQLVSCAARTLERWCAVASEASFLVTSRERLGVTGECVLELAPLELPRVGEADAARQLASEAAVLFQERARAAGGWGDAHATSASFAAGVAELVRELDGIPLAIELAAARSRLLAPDELLARIRQRRSDVLSSSARERREPRRHATLTGAIDWSWNMLSDHEKSALAQCAVFAGDFSLEAAERVLSLSEEPAAPSVIDVLAGLTDKSLVKSKVDSATRTTRFSLYSSIREYAAERARERGDEPATLARHRRHYIDATRPWADAYARRGDTAALALLTAEKENLLAIQRRLREISPSATTPLASLAPEEAADLARAVLHLAPLVSTESAYDEQMSMVSAAVAAARAASDDALLGRLLVQRGSAYGLRGETAKCLADVEAARDVGRALGDRVLQGQALVEMGVRYRQLGRFEESWSVGREAAALLEEQEHPRIEGTNLACTGLLLSELGRADESRSYNLRARSILYAAGDRWSEALTLANLAQLDQAAGELERAEHGYDRAIERFRESGDRRFEGRYLCCRAGLALERGDPEAARPLYAMAVEIFEVLRSWHIEGLTRACLGALEAISGHARDAMTELDRASDLLSTTNAPAFVSALGVHRGQLDLLLSREAEARGDVERARVLDAAARARLTSATHEGSSEDVRFAVRLLARELERHALHARSGSVSEPRAPARQGLLVGPDARWFSVGDAPPIDLGRRGALRLVLDGLVDRRLETPGATTDWEALLGLGWPGERVLAGAGATRVRVAISTLRRLGLAGMLVTRESGYLLDPRAPVRRSPDV